MSLTLHDAFVPNCQQILTGLANLVDKGEAYVKQHGIADTELLGAQLAETMWKLPWHVRSCWIHSASALDQIPTGEFTPDFTDVPESWDAMRTMIADAQDRLSRATEDELEAFADREVFFVIGGKRLMRFTGQDFLLSFNQPNFYFHAATFYDILRMKGVELSKRDYLGAMRMMPAA